MIRDDKFDEHPLDAWLDAESESEFGEPEIRDRMDPAADENASGNLKEWTAQHFASIYVRFRPHLERHARRYLSNPVQAEDVVQDAFLYLMTSLPELDSELGVLKFLKWKIRLLSLDVIRASAYKREITVPEHAEYASDAREVIADLERAEDSAVIHMALAKLNPRQREALIASVYEEKSSEEVAEQLGLSPNATRQLLFRARSALRKALVGEAEIQGKSLSQVLSIAAKKAAYDAKENATKVGALLVLAAAGVGMVLSVAPSNETVMAQRPSIEQSQSQEQSNPAIKDALEKKPDKPEPTEAAPSVPEYFSQEELSETSGASDFALAQTALIAAPSGSASSTFVTQSAMVVESEPFDPWTVDHLFEDTIGSPFVIDHGSSASGGRSYTLASDEGLWTDFKFAPNTPSPISDFRVGFIAQSSNFFADPKVSDFYVVNGGNVQIYVFVAELDKVSDTYGKVWSNTRVDGASVSLELVVSNETQQILDARISVS